MIKLQSNRVRYIFKDAREGIREIYFGDQTFFANRVESLKICKGIMEKNLDLSWSCYSRVDIFNEDILKIMNWIQPRLQHMDQSGSFAVVQTDELSGYQIFELRKKAEKEFYFRFNYILKRLINIKSLYELKMDILQAWELLRKCSL